VNKVFNYVICYECFKHKDVVISLQDIQISCGFLTNEDNETKIIKSKLKQVSKIKRPIEYDNPVYLWTDVKEFMDEFIKKLSDDNHIKTGYLQEFEEREKTIEKFKIIRSRKKNLVDIMNDLVKKIDSDILIEEDVKIMEKICEYAINFNILQSYAIDHILDRIYQLTENKKDKFTNIKNRVHQITIKLSLIDNPKYDMNSTYMKKLLESNCNSWLSEDETVDIINDVLLKGHKTKQRL